MYKLLRSGELEQYYEIDPKNSWMLAACEKNIPITVPGWEDSTMGNIFTSYCIKGELKLNPEGFTPEFVAAFDTLYVNGEPVRVKSRRVHKSTLLLTLPGVEDMDAALALKGREVSIRREDARLPAGEYFDAELEGLTVLDDATGAELGKLHRVLHYPAHKVYEVRGAREYLIPAVPGVFIASVDVDGGTLRVHNMKGLATDEN